MKKNRRKKYYFILAYLFIFCVPFYAYATIKSPILITSWTQYALNDLSIDRNGNLLGIYDSTGSEILTRHDQEGIQSLFKGIGGDLGGVVSDKNGVIYVKRKNASVKRISQNGEELDDWRILGDDIDINSQGNFVIVDAENDSVKFYDSSGNYINSWINENLDEPHHLAINKDSDVYYILNDGNDSSEIQKYSSDGTLLAQWSTPSHRALNIAVDSSGNVYVSTVFGVELYDSQGGFKINWSINEYNTPVEGIAIDNSDNIYLAGGARKVYKYTFDRASLIKEKKNAVYRFYSPQYNGHFYTTSIIEARSIAENDYNWNYEGIAYSAIDSDKNDSMQVHRFWSDSYNHHFYTVSDAEKDYLINNDKNWIYEGGSYYVYGDESSGTQPVYRFWSDVFKAHFYTISEVEKDNLIDNDPNWDFEGVAWHVMRE